MHNEYPYEYALFGKSLDGSFGKIKTIDDFSNTFHTAYIELSIYAVDRQYTDYYITRHLTSNRNSNSLSNPYLKPNKVKEVWRVVSPDKLTLEEWVNASHSYEVDRIPNRDGGGYLVTSPLLESTPFWATGETVEEAIKTFEAKRISLFSELTQPVLILEENLDILAERKKYREEN